MNVSKFRIVIANAVQRGKRARTTDLDSVLIYLKIISYICIFFNNGREKRILRNVKNQNLLLSKVNCMFCWFVLDGMKLAEKYRVKFIETSAILNKNIEVLFEGTVNQIYLRERKKESLRYSRSQKKDLVVELNPRKRSLVKFASTISAQIYCLY